MVYCVSTHSNTFIHFHAHSNTFMHIHALTYHRHLFIWHVSSTVRNRLRNRKSYLHYGKKIVNDVLHSMILWNVRTKIKNEKKKKKKRRRIIDPTPSIYHRKSSFLLIFYLLFFLVRFLRWKVQHIVSVLSVFLFFVGILHLNRWVHQSETLTQNYPINILRNRNATSFFVLFTDRITTDSIRNENEEKNHLIALFVIKRLLWVCVCVCVYALILNWMIIFLVKSI